MTVVSIDAASRTPPGEQLRSQLALMIAAGTLGVGDRLPSVRQLAADLAVAPGTVARVYRDLEQSGHLVTRKTGTFVADLGARADEERRTSLVAAANAYAEQTRRAGFGVKEAVDAVRRAYQQLPTST